MVRKVAWSAVAQAETEDASPASLCQQRARAAVYLCAIAPLAVLVVLWALAPAIFIRITRIWTPDVRPTIVLLEADQVRVDSHARTRSPARSFSVAPNLDRIAAQGASFTRAYSSTPVCTPARLALLTGRSTWRHGMRSYQAGIPLEDASRLELVSTMARHGYHTAVVGKNHYGIDSERVRF
eukprot:2597099-Prymnesium_polylepis.1